MTARRQGNQTIVGRSFVQQQNYQSCPNVHNIIASDTSAHILHSTMTVSFTKKNVIIFQSTFQYQSSTRSTDRQQDHKDIATMDASDED